MTRHFGPSDHDQAAHHWLTHHQHALVDTLGDLLDTEAGLREILLQSRHDAATDNLDTVLDTEAGLAAILPAPPSPPADTQDTPPCPTNTMLFRELSPADRMALRNNPDVKTASQALARALDRERGLRIAHSALDLAFDLAGALTRDLDVAPAVTRILDLDTARGLALALGHVLDRASAADLDRALDRALDLADALDRAVDLDRDRAASIFGFGLAPDITRALARVRDLTRVLEITRDRDRAVDRVHDLIVDIRTVEVGRAIGLALRREPLVLDKDSLHVFLDDFTATDLSNADLTGVDLSGVRWSEHTTQWPPIIDVEDLKTRSDETPFGSGTWIVRSGTATIRDHAER
ncbi:hypothetical protein OOK27_21745 [Streptomyces canus]|uniref:hypothetical protein n=1 Tax=Streptomyces canus TaxID=58343 RepID=UPI00224FB3F4|nr:hypothetical protein [Streptomyces canus]MCX5256726.1 hypothetical protein [Streptomyces canus]